MNSTEPARKIRTTKTRVSHRPTLAFVAILLWMLAGIFGTTGAVSAAPRPQALVQTVKGTLRVQRATQKTFVALSRREGLYPGDVVSTGPDSKTTLLFEDGSQLRLHEKTSIVITARTPVGRGKTSLFRIVHGKVMARLRPGNAVQTRSAIAGVRGTVFTLDVADTSTILTVLEGQVEFFNPHGTALVDPSEQSVARLGSAPSVPITVQNPGLTIEWTLDLNRAFIPREKFYISLDPAVVREELQKRQTAASASPGDAAVRLQLGDALFDSKHYADALTEYRAARRLAADWSKPLTRIGHILLEKDLLDEAENFFRQALSTRTESPLHPASWTPASTTSTNASEIGNNQNEDASIGLSWVALKRNDADEATGAARKAVIARNENPRAQFMGMNGPAPSSEGGAYIALGLSLMRQPARADEAFAAFEQALEKEPEPLRYQARAWLAMLHLSRDEAAQALAHAREAAQMQPHSGLAHGNLSLALFFGGDARGAQREAQTAVSIDPDSVAARCALGQALLAQGNVDAATREAAHAVSLDPEQPQARYLLGICDASRRDYTHAVLHLEESVAQAPDFLPAVSALARIYTGMGRKTEAVELLSDLLPRGRNTDGVHAALGLVRYEQGDYPGAVSEYRTALKSKPNSAMYHAELARTLLYSNQLNASIEAAQQAVALAPEVGQYRAILGMALDYSGLKSQSERALREALQLDPGNALALTQLAYRHVGSDLRPAAASYAQGFLQDPSVATQLLRGGVQTELTPVTGSNNSRDFGITRRLDAADGKLHAIGFLNRDTNSSSREFDRTRQKDIGSYITYQTNPRTNLYLNLRRVREQRTLAGLEPQPTDNDTSALTYGQAQFAMRRRFGERHALWLGLFSNSSRHTTLDPQRDSFFDNGTGLGISQQKFDSRAVMPEVRLDFNLGATPARPSVLSFGVARARTSFRSNRDLFNAPATLNGQSRGTRDGTSLLGYAQWERRVNERFGFIAQLRAQRVEDRSSASIALSNSQFGQASSNRTQNFLLPSLVATYRAAKNTNLRLTAGKRHTDTTASTFAPVETLLATERSASPYGTPELQNTLQLDVEQNFGKKTFLKLWAFDNSARNVQIGGSDLLGFGGGLAAANAPSIQLARWNARGVGARVEHQLGNRIFANLSMVARQTSNRSFGPAFNALWDNGDAPYEPSRIGSFDLNYIDPKGNKMGFRFRHVGSFFADSPLSLGRPRFAAQNYVDLRLAKEPSVAREFFVQLSNVFDQPEIDFQGFSKGGRRVEFGMTQRF
ncbi:MAG TPA: tetratricopeptide repeat protein [Abditibacteriaceae bacterium]|jgi:tetratricopeptide (TPR) repeat protein